MVAWEVRSAARVGQRDMPVLGGRDPWGSGLLGQLGGLHDDSVPDTGPESSGVGTRFLPSRLRTCEGGCGLPTVSTLSGLVGASWRWRKAGL